MNGAAALQLVEPAPTPSGEIEQHIAVAVADAVSVLSRGMLEYWNDGKLTPATKMAGSEHVAALYSLTQAVPTGVDFAAVARSEGRRVLQERHGGDLPEPVLDEVIGGLLEILANVERAMAN
jgi:hypothetical protein